MEYIQNTHAEDEACVFCSAPKAGDDVGRYILHRSALAFVILNAYPYNPGHLMVAPFRHVSDFEDLTPAELADGSALLQRSVGALREMAEPHGYNVGMNLGRVAGAGIPDHLHWHVVPRWSGDTNYVTVVGETRVLPELLGATYAKLRPLFAADRPST